MLAAWRSFSILSSWSWTPSWGNILPSSPRGSWTLARKRRNYNENVVINRQYGNWAQPTGHRHDRGCTVWIIEGTHVLTFLRFGDSFKECTCPWSSPAIIMGSIWLKLTWVNFALFTTFCSHSGSCLFSDRSKTWTYEAYRTLNLRIFR